MTDKKKPISREELEKIMELIAQAYEEGGKKLTTATLFDEENPEGEILIDHREDKDLN
jgi:hypothetical protein